jgi:hypothetical protein
MKAEIVSFTRVRSIDAPPVDSFGYRLYGDGGLLHEDAITIRTARVFAAELEGSSAFMRMVQIIAAAAPSRYRSLVGQVFSD